MPDLDFRVEGAEVLEFAAVPSLLFKLRIESLDEEPIRSAAGIVRLVRSSGHGEIG